MLGKFSRALKIIKLYANFPIAFLNYSKITKREMVIKLRDKTRYLIRNNHDDLSVINDIYIHKPYQDYLQAIRKGGTVIDIGANIGGFSILAARQSKNVKVYSFEPSSDNFDILSKNIKLNSLSNQIKPFKFAVSSKDEEIVMNLCDSPLGNSIHPINSEKKQKVMSVSLKSIIRTNRINRIDYLKVDCEGAEFEIINSLSKQDFDKIRRIALEYHENYNLGKAKDLKRVLENNGFVVYCDKTTPWGMIYAEK